MKNVDFKTDGSKLVITIDTSKEFGKSKTGKTTIIASTEGNQPIAVGSKVVTLGLNVYRK